MMRSMATFLSASAIVAIHVLHSVDASAVEATCKAAADSDKHVIYEFCVEELSKYPNSTHADTRGLAKVAAAVGAINAKSSMTVLSALLTKPGTDPEASDVLVQCKVDYTDVDYSFNRAHDLINRRVYGDGKEAAGIATNLAQDCEDRFAKAKIPSPVTAHSWYTAQIATIFTAITNLIK